MIHSLRSDFPVFIELYCLHVVIAPCMVKSLINPSSSGWFIAIQPTKASTCFPQTSQFAVGQSSSIILVILPS